MLYFSVFKQMPFHNKLSEMNKLFSSLLLGSLCIITLLKAYPAGAQNAKAVEQGEKLFQQNCTSCHKLGTKLIGPDLLGVNDLRPHDWLVSWVKNSQDVVNSGDEYAQNLFKEYNEVVMPPMPLNDDQINAVLAYIKSQSESGTTAEGSGDQGKQVASSGAVSMVKGDMSSDGNFKLLISIISLLLIVIFFIAFNTLQLVLKLNEVALPKINYSKLNASLFIGFIILWFAGIAYELDIHTKYIHGRASSLHGGHIDELFIITLIITSIVFVVVQITLFSFAFKYRGKKGRKGLYYPENNKLEFFWTAIPAIVLAILVVLGLKTWNSIMSPASPETPVVEVLAQQFQWQYRYPGPDGKLTPHDFTFISTNNPFGLGVKSLVEEKINNLKSDIKNLEGKLKEATDEDKANTIKGSISDKKAVLKVLNEKIKNKDLIVSSSDDFMTHELHLPVNKQVDLKFRSKDVIHSFWLSQFRVQLYCQPGINSSFKFTPTKTTEEMREELNDENFNYEVACNQICGAAHYTMRSIVVIEDEKSYHKWLADQEPSKEVSKSGNDLAKL